MKGIYICITPMNGSPPAYEMKEKLENMGYKSLPTPIANSWCKRADTLGEAKNIIREANDLGFGTSPLFRKRRDVFIDLADEDMKASNELYFFKKEHALL